MLTNMAAFLEENPHHHKPIREVGCSACHQPHAGEHANMLVMTYPQQFYSPFTPENYALCFNCHREEMVKDEHGVGLTRFRHGDVNLHWLHVNREKGRTCRACHSVHASRNPFHIRDEVPFGPQGWLLEVGYEMTEAGGRCSSGCHKTYDYDRGGGGELDLEAILKPPKYTPPQAIPEGGQP
ncbi:MAG: cytochrome c3 family protein [Planctomycetota bacterium]|jgi:predicted CXXCH cytochrome family protein